VLGDDGTFGRWGSQGCNYVAGLNLAEPASRRLIIGVTGKKYFFFLRPGSSSPRMTSRQPFRRDTGGTFAEWNATEFEEKFQFEYKYRMREPLVCTDNLN